MPPARKVILDTDIGDDIDDAFALALALQSPELDIVGVTTAYGPTEKRAKMALKILHAAGRDDVPVAVGLRTHDSDPNQYPYAADYAETAPIAEGAVEFILRTLDESAGDVTLIAYGPLTNLGAAIRQAPETMRRVRELIIMGGMIGPGSEKAGEYRPEYNIKCDIPAAQTVFRAGLPLTMVGLDVTMLCDLDSERRAAIAAAGTPLAEAVLAMLRLWPRDTPILHDPLAVSLAVDPSFVTTVARHVEVDDEGFTRVRAGAPPNARVCTTVDRARFLDFFTKRLCAPRA
jgi:purine nucleosidase